MNRVARFLILFAVFWLILWGLASFAVPKVFGAVLPKLAGKFQGAGITLEELDFEEINVSPLLVRLNISNVSAMFDLKPTDKQRLRSKFSAIETVVYLNRPLQKRGGVIVDNFDVQFDPSDRPVRLPFDGFSKGYVHIHSLPLTNPKQAIIEIVEGFEELFLDNELVGDFEFSGEVLVRVDDSTLPALVYTERQGKYFRLRFSKPDIEKIAQAADVGSL